MNKNEKDKIKFRLFNSTNSKDKLFGTVHVDKGVSSHINNANKLIPVSSGVRASSTTKNTKSMNNKTESGGSSMPIKVVKKYQTEGIRMSSETLPPRQQVSKYSKYSLNLKKNNNSQTSQNSQKKPQSQSHTLQLNPFTFAPEKSLSHRILTSTNQNSKQNYLSISNRNAGIRDVNSLCSFDNSNNNFSKPNFTMEEHSVERAIERKHSNKPIIPKKENFRIIKDKIPYKIKEKVNNIRIYSKPQMILVEDRSEGTFNTNLNANPTVNLRNTTHLAKSNIHEVLLKNFQENVKKNRGKNILTKLKIPTNKGIFNKLSFVNISQGRCNTLDDIRVDNLSNRSKQNTNNYSVEDYLYNKAASFQENLEKDSFDAPAILNFPAQKKLNAKNIEKDHLRYNNKHEDYRRKQEKSHTVKLPEGLNISEKEKELDKIFSSLIFESDGNLEPIESDQNQPDLELDSDSRNDPSEECDKNESGVLTFDEVKDIIVYFHFRDFDAKDKHVFGKNDYENFNKRKKQAYMNHFFNFHHEGATINVPDINKSYSTKDSSSNKKNFNSVIKLIEN